MPYINVTRRHLLLPRQNLGRFTIEQAELARSELGFGFVVWATAPRNYLQLQRLFDHCLITGSSYPVNSAHADNAILDDLQVTWAFRFVHDMQHGVHRLTFSTDDEGRVGEHLLAKLHASGYSLDSKEYLLLQAETVGRARCFAQLGRFPSDQRLFDYDCVDRGVDAAIELEAILTDPVA